LRNIFIMRHGRAEGMGSASDSERRLTEDGESGIRRIAAALATLGIQADALWHSPFERARRTAELVAEQVTLGPKRSHEGVTPSGMPSLIASEIRAARGSLFVVSHLPLIPGVLSELCGGVSFNVTPGTVTHLSDVGRSQMVVRGFYEAAGLERLG